MAEQASEQALRVGRLSHRVATRLAWSLWALTVALTGLSLLLLTLNLSHPGTHIFDWWLGNALVVIDATVGAIVASLLPIMIGLQVSYLLLFPTGRLPSRRWRWLAWLIGAFIVVGVVVSAFSPGAYLGSLGPIRNPLGIEGFTVVYKAVLYTTAPFLFGAAAFSVFMRLGRAVGVERQQIKWFAYAAALYALSIILNVITLVIDAPRWFEWAGTIIFTAAGTTIPISIGIAILRYRLYDIDILINRTLVYGTLTATLIGLSFGGIVVLQRVF